MQVLDAPALLSVSHDLMSVMLGFQVETCDVRDVDAGPMMTSEIRILGDQAWRLEVSCPYVTASVIAARIFRVPPADLDDDMLLDALGEVANIVSGNLKGMLDGEHSLSLPFSAIRPLSPADPDSPPPVTVALLCDEMPLQMTLCQESAEPSISEV